MSQSTRGFLESLFASIHTHGFGPAFHDALSDDLVWTVTGSSPLTGVYTSKQAYLDHVLQPLLERLDTKIKPTIEHMVVEGEWASVHFSSKDVTAKNGADFSMHYVWLMRIVERKVVEVIGFYDQKKMWDVFA